MFSFPCYVFLFISWC